MFRCGNKNAGNIYYVTDRGDELHVGVMFTESLGRYVVEALTAHAAEPPLSAHAVELFSRTPEGS